ncbi:rCG23916, partial [Rattus norvegicus]
MTFNFLASCLCLYMSGLQ